MLEPPPRRIRAREFPYPTPISRVCDNCGRLDNRVPGFKTRAQYASEIEIAVRQWYLVALVPIPPPVIERVDLLMALALACQTVDGVGETLGFRVARERRRRDGFN